ncbi:Rho termination factor N-terminal domain-containing protein [Halorubrum sp. DTA98]|uniref:Rho termination factor N-terminal domain-containing protein n=1 Tax=Halorubrum sp. DTA98 TaxID=3402163 RepID=UPI003AAC99B2
MPSIEITDEQHDRITTLREELAAAHENDYTSVTVPDVLAYLLDLADTVDDPDRRAEIDTADGEDAGPRPFPRVELKAALSDRTRRQSEDGAESPMDLYSIAAEYDITGRSNLTKRELITAILDATEQRYTDPFAPVDVDFPDTVTDEAEPDADDGEDADPDAGEPDGSDAGDGGAGQLNAMLDLLDTHSDKWESGNGDARYEVTLPDGSVESARTKDDVRALLFRHY